MPAIDDAERLDEFLRRIAGGDREAFRELYAATSPRLLAIAQRILRRREVAEDVLQEAYLTIWGKAGQQLTGRASAFGWMATIVRHRAIDRLRSEKAEARHLSPDAEVADLPAAVVSMEAAPAQLARMSKCLGALPRARREALLLAYYQGHSHAELARQLGVPLGTVKSWIRRSLLQLRECLER